VPALPAWCRVRRGKLGSYEAYRDKGLECLAVAQTIADPHERLILLEIAKRWLRLAEYAASKSTDRKTPED
jgi:hypothetical protein